MRLITAIACALTIVVACDCRAATKQDAPLRLLGTIPMPGVDGRIDHMAVDLKQNRLFVAALGNDTVEVIDVKAGKRIRSLTGFREPQGIGYDEKTNTLLVANGDNGDVDFLDGASLATVGKLHLGDDADDVRVDDGRHQAVVGYGEGALAVVDFASRKLVGQARFPGHPEAFVLGQSEMFLNVPSEGRVEVIDRGKLSVTKHWSVTDAGANFPIALDEAGKRLFVGCRRPARLLVYDSADAKLVDSIAIDGDTDDIYFDGRRKLIYISCGTGIVDVIGLNAANRYRRIASVPTGSGARTSMFVPEMKRLFVAAPRGEGREASIMVFSTQP